MPPKPSTPQKGTPKRPTGDEAAMRLYNRGVSNSVSSTTGPVIFQGERFNSIHDVHRWIERLRDPHARVEAEIEWVGMLQELRDFFGGFIIEVDERVTALRQAGDLNIGLTDREWDLRWEHVRWIANNIRDERARIQEVNNRVRKAVGEILWTNYIQYLATSRSLMQALSSYMNEKTGDPPIEKLRRLWNAAFYRSTTSQRGVSNDPHPQARDVIKARELTSEQLAPITDRQIRDVQLNAYNRKDPRLWYRGLCREEGTGIVLHAPRQAMADLMRGHDVQKTFNKVGVPSVADIQSGAPPYVQAMPSAIKSIPAACSTSVQPQSRSGSAQPQSRSGSAQPRSRSGSAQPSNCNDAPYSPSGQPSSRKKRKASTSQGLLEEATQEKLLQKTAADAQAPITQPPNPAILTDQIPIQSSVISNAFWQLIQHIYNMGFQNQREQQPSIPPSIAFTLAGADPTEIANTFRDLSVAVRQRYHDDTAIRIMSYALQVGYHLNNRIRETRPQADMYRILREWDQLFQHQGVPVRAGTQFDNAFTVNRAGINSLLAGPAHDGWLNDDALMASIALAADPDRVQVIDNFAWTHWRQTGQVPWIDDRRAARLTLFPINVNNNHWVLGYANPHTREIGVLDSLPITNETHHDIRRDIRQLMGYYNWIYDNSQEWHINFNRSELQGNDQDCGLYVIANAWALIAGRNPGSELLLDGMGFRRNVMQQLFTAADRMRAVPPAIRQLTVYIQNNNPNIERRPAHYEQPSHPMGPAPSQQPPPSLLPMMENLRITHPTPHLRPGAEAQVHLRLNSPIPRDADIYSISSIASTPASTPTPMPAPQTPGAARGPAGPQTRSSKRKDQSRGK